MYNDDVKYYTFKNVALKEIKMWINLYSPIYNRSTHQVVEKSSKSCSGYMNE